MSQIVNISRPAAALAATLVCCAAAVAPVRVAGPILRRDDQLGQADGSCSNALLEAASGPQPGHDHDHDHHDHHANDDRHDALGGRIAPHGNRLELDALLGAAMLAGGLTLRRVWPAARS